MARNVKARAVAHLLTPPAPREIRDLVEACRQGRAKFDAIYGESVPDWLPRRLWYPRKSAA
jgi:hypothetical protein